MAGEPVLTKAHSDPERDYKLMTWERLLLLRAWAKYVAYHWGCTVALVGSVLAQDQPRDIDVALIWPAAEYEARFGPLYIDEKGATHSPASFEFKAAHIALWSSGQELVSFDTRIDVRLCPDSWWPEKDRLILATPAEVEPPNRWGDVEFVIRKVVQAAAHSTQREG